MSSLRNSPIFPPFFPYFPLVSPHQVLKSPLPLRSPEALRASGGSAAAFAQSTRAQELQQMATRLGEDPKRGKPWQNWETVDVFGFGYLSFWEPFSFCQLRDLTKHWPFYRDCMVVNPLLLHPVRPQLRHLVADLSLHRTRLVLPLLL